MCKSQHGEKITLCFVCLGKALSVYRSQKTGVNSRLYTAERVRDILKNAKERIGHTFTT